MLTLLAIAMASGLFFILEQRQREAVSEQLAAIAQLRSGELEAWLAERRLDAETLAADPGIREDARLYGARGEPAAGSRLRRQLAGSRASSSAISIEVIDGKGTTLLASGPAPQTGGLPGQPRPPATSSFVDLDADGAEGLPHFSYVLPLGNPAQAESRSLPYLRVNISPERHIYPLLRKWPLPGSGGETLLVRREGDQVAFLGSLRHLPDTGSSLHRPLADPDLPAARALRSGAGRYSGLDYRGVRVLAAARPVAGTPWMLIAKQDEEEVLSGLRQLRNVCIAITLVGALFGGLLCWRIARRQEMQSRQALEDQFMAVANSVPGIICSYRRRADGTSSFPYAAPAIRELCGMAPEQLAKDGALLLNMVHPEDLARMKRSMAESAATLTHWHGEFRVLRPQGQEAWMEGHFAPQREADGSLLWHGYLHDVTARRAAEDGLRHAEKRYRTLLDNLPGAAYRCVIGPPARIVFLSDGAEAVTGYPVAQLIHPEGPRWVEVVHPADLAAYRQAVGHGIAMRRPYEIEYRIRHADGQLRWLYEKGCPISGDDGRAEWLDGVIIDITARVEAEAEVAAAGERWRQLAESLPQLVWTCLPDGSCDYVNLRWIAYTGLAGDNLGHRWLDIVHTGDRGRLVAAWNRARAEGDVCDGEYRLLHHSGECRWFKMRLQPVRDESGRVSKWYGTNTDIQELKEAEDALHRALLRQQGLHQLDRAVLEASTPEEVAAKGLAHLAALLPFRYADARTFDHDAGTACLLACRAGEDPVDEAGSQISLAAYGYGDVNALRQGRLCVVADLASQQEVPSSLKGWHGRGIRSYLRLPLFAEGRLVGALTLTSEQAGHFGNSEIEVIRPVADVLAMAIQQTLLRRHLARQAAMLEIRVAERTTELARMKDKAETANRAKSQFLANISHELRTPLNSLLILSQLLADNVQSNLSAEQVGFARVIHDAGSDLLNLVNDILDLSKIEAGRTVVDARELTPQSLLDYLERLFHPQAENKGLRLDLELAPKLPATLTTDQNHLRPILRNLVANAIKFTAAGRVSVRIMPADSGWSPDHPVLSKAAGVLAFVVRDTGIGIAANKLPLIFDAFEQADASIPRRYGGTGLGLHIARLNTGLLGGELTVASVLGQGSVFTLYLPVTYAGPAALPAPGDNTSAAKAEPEATKPAAISYTQVG